MGQNEPILQSVIPEAQRAAARAALPRMQPVRGCWLTRDDAFDGQLAEKVRLLQTRRDDVLAVLPGAGPACVEALEHICAELDVSATSAMLDDPLMAISGLIQEDICILQKQGDEHVLTAALLGFPAGWTLAEKLGRPLTRIHEPVAPYDTQIASRVQRFFDGVQVGRPLWRANLLRYDTPQLYYPRKEQAPRRQQNEGAMYERSERQTVLRLPRTDAVVFAIHTSVVRCG